MVDKLRVLLLEDSLLDFSGAVVLVSHDRYLLDRVSTTVLGLDGGEGGELTEREIGGLVINLRDVDDQKRAHTQLLHTALHDSLTGMPNRILFTERLQSALDRVAHLDGHAVAVLFIDAREQAILL